MQIKEASLQAACRSGHCRPITSKLAMTVLVGALINIRIECLWRTIKYEGIFIRSYDSLNEARKGINTFIEHYNHGRPHQALGYKTPAMVYFQDNQDECMVNRCMNSDLI